MKPIRTLADAVAFVRAEAATRKAFALQRYRRKETIDGDLLAGLSLAISAAADALEAAIAATPPASPWRDMATAPRDGTPIVLQGDDLRVEGKTVVAHWGTYVIEYWHVEDGKFEPRPLRGPEPTRWMPLPSPPTQATTQEA